MTVKTLRTFWERPGHEDAEQPLKAWLQEAKRSDWQTPAQVKASYRSASLIPGARVVFNIAGNKYRLVVKINYPYRIVYIRFVGTHHRYDAIDVTEI